MQKVVIIPEAEFNNLVARVEELSGKVEAMENSQAQWLRTHEAEHLTGLKRDALYDLRQRGEVDYKYEGRTVLYLRTSLEAYNKKKRRRRDRTSHLKVAS